LFLKAKEISMLVVHKDKRTRQLLAMYLCETYECAIEAAPSDADQILAQKSFDLLIAPRVMADSREENERARSASGKLPALVALIRSRATSTLYELRLINQDAESYIPNPFDLVLLRSLIERAELGFRILSIEKAPHEPRT
jgi:DNA-binding response OmpR family regulator